MRYGLERTPLKVQPFKVSEALYRKHVGFAKSYVFRKTFSLQLLLLSLFDSFFLFSYKEKAVKFSFRKHMGSKAYGLCF